MRTIEEIIADYKDCQSCENKGCLGLTCNCPKDGSIFTREAELMQAVLRIIPLDRLREMCAAEREQRCAVLPCKVGGTVYPHCLGYVDEGTIESFTISKYGLSAHFVATDTAEGSYRADDFGKTVFLTREAAEAALKGASND